MKVTIESIEVELSNSLTINRNKLYIKLTTEQAYQLWINATDLELFGIYSDGEALHIKNMSNFQYAKNNGVFFALKL